MSEIDSQQSHMHAICKNYPLKKCEGDELRQLSILLSIVSVSNDVRRAGELSDSELLQK